MEVSPSGWWRWYFYNIRMTISNFCSLFLSRSNSWFQFIMWKVQSWHCNNIKPWSRLVWNLERFGVWGCMERVVCGVGVRGCFEVLTMCIKFIDTKIFQMRRYRWSALQYGHWHCVMSDVLAGRWPFLPIIICDPGFHMSNQPLISHWFDIEGLANEEWNPQTRIIFDFCYK